MDAEAGQRTVDVDSDLDLGQRQRMAERDQLGGALGCHHAGKLGSLNHRALGCRPGADLLERFGLAGQHSDRRRGSGGRLLTGDIDHARAA